MQQAKSINWPIALVLLMLGGVAVYCAPKGTQGYAIASSTAIFIAFVAYPWQKQKDREHKLAEERRAAYRRYIEFVLYARDEITKAIVSIKEQSDIVDLSVVNEALQEYSRKLGHETAFINLIADDDIAKKANEINTVLEAVMSDPKSDISQQEQYTGAQVQSFMLTSLQALRERLDLRFSELIFLMRGREFLNSTQATSESRSPLALAGKVTPNTDIR